jgi:CPA2 family monovalent cation:H+ antiporter-2
VSRERRLGHEVYFGDVTNAAYLDTIGLKDARAVIITIHTHSIIDEIVRLVRARRPDIPIISRARDAAHARHLYMIGVSDAVPETIEASLQLSEAALVDLGVPMGLVIASIHEKRDEFRHELQEAALAAGQEPRPRLRSTKRS